MFDLGYAMVNVFRWFASAGYFDFDYTLVYFALIARQIAVRIDSGSDLICACMLGPSLGRTSCWHRAGFVLAAAH